MPRELLLRHFIDCDDYNIFWFVADTIYDLYYLLHYVEWYHELDPELAAAEGYDPEDWLFDPELDVFIGLLKEVNGQTQEAT